MPGPAASAERPVNEPGGCEAPRRDPALLPEASTQEDGQPSPEDGLVHTQMCEKDGIMV